MEITWQGVTKWASRIQGWVVMLGTITLLYNSFVASPIIQYIPNNFHRLDLRVDSLRNDFAHRQEIMDTGVVKTPVVRALISSVESDSLRIAGLDKRIYTVEFKVSKWGN